MINIFKRKEKFLIGMFQDNGLNNFDTAIKTDKGLYLKKSRRYVAYPKRYFKTYKQALRFLQNYINQKTILSNYEPSDIDIALMKLFESKTFMRKIK